MNVREIALDSYSKIMDGGGYSNIVIDHAIEAHPLNNEDRRLLTELVYGTISRKLTLEYYLKPFIKTKLKRWQRNLLNLTVYQIEYLDKIPNYAAIDEAVEITKSFAGFREGNKINAILRSYLRDGRKSTDSIKNEITRLSIKYSLPKWIVNQFRSHYSLEETEKIASSLLERPKMYVRVNNKQTNRQELISILKEEGVEATASVIHKNAVEVTGGGITKTKAYKNGLFGIQDASSMCVNYALDPKGVELVLDACSAPGGKGFHALENMEGHVDFSDIHAHKLTLIEYEKKRLKHVNLDIMLKDASKDLYDKQYDKIIVDAPCSGLGVLKRKPEIKYKIKESDIESFVRLQLSILNHVTKFLKPGGTLVYSTCTLHQMENENVAYTFMKQVDEIEFDEFQIEAFNFKGAYRQILPYEFDTDGFFIAKFKKKS